MRQSLALLLSLTLLPIASSAHAQDADPVSAESEVGYEMALSGVTSGERGSTLRLTGIAYEVQGVSDLRATAGLEVDVAIHSWRRDRSGRDRVANARARTVAGGRFDVSIAVPEQDLSGAQLELTISRPQRPGRTFRYPLGQLPARELDAMTDRARYQPGETVRVWSLLRAARGRAPIAGQPITLRLIDARGAPIAERTVETGASGAVSAELAIPRGAETGGWSVTASAPATSPAHRPILVVQRTVERLQVQVTLASELVEPGQPVRGRVRVTTPSGSPVRGAAVQLTVGDPDAPPVALITDDEGIAAIDTPAPSFLSGDVATMQVIARVTHAAYGTLAAAAPYTLARTRWLVSATPEAGGLVPEIDSQLFLSIADPRGRPAPAGTEVEVRGLGLRGGSAVATADAHGIAVVTLRLPRGAAARMQGGSCSADPSTSLEVEVRTTPVVVARVCARVAIEAQVLARVSSPIVAPGTALEVELFRRPSASNRPVLIELLDGARALASAWVDGGARRATLSIPGDVQGVLRVRARPIAAEGDTNALDVPGATVVARGSIAAVLVRPGDAFALTLTPDQPLHRVRERAEIAVRTSSSPESGWITLVARDEAAHGGEHDYARHWLAGELGEAIRGPIDPAHDRFVRASLASGLPMDAGVTEPEPLVREPWDVRGPGWSPVRGMAGGVLRDPIAAREELRRRGIGQAMLAIERMVARLGEDGDPERAQYTTTTGRRVDFRPDVIERLVASGHLHESQARTLGGQRLTVAMLTQVDPGFTFDRVARRVARARLVRLMVALSTFSGTDDPAAARASAGQPPDRWLARMVQLGMIEAEALMDPWGRPFVFRRVTGRPAWVLSDRAVDFELASPGPDGTLGNADDVRDPFERAIPQRTPYAVASGEDALMQQLSRLAPGRTVLTAMASAYARLGLAAQEERRRGPVTATTSEAEAPPPPPASPMPAMEAAPGYGAEGAYGGAAALDEMAREESSGMPAQRPRRSAESRAREPADRDADGILDQEDREQAIDTGTTTRMQSMGELVREDFPATLFFLGEAPLDAAGTARVSIQLADALTTYRIEAVAWTSTGWLASGRTNVRVDQDAMIDAPIPTVAVIGDVIRLPVRLQNRSAAPIRARIELALEGGLAIELGSIAPVEVAAGEGAEVIVELRPRAAGQGTVVARAVREDGTPLDAVRRPIRVVEDARRVIERREELVGAGDAIAITIPAGALPRGPAQLRLSIAGAIVGDPTEWSAGDPIWGGWALAMADRELPEAVVQMAAAYVRLEEHQDEGRWYGHDPVQLAAALSIAWQRDVLDPRAGSALLRFLTNQLPDPGAGARLEDIRMGPASPSWILVMLAPAIAHAGERPELREDLARLVERLRRLTSAEGAQAVDAPATWARVAAALGLSRGGHADARATEMLRRTERHVIAVGDQAWLEPDVEEGTAEPRIEPSALLALARIAMGEPRGAIPLIRSIALVARGAPRWGGRARALASAAAARIASPVREVRVTLDGAPIEIALEGGIATATLDGLARPGERALQVELPDGALALAHLEIRYALPWDVRPRRESSLELAWTGEMGGRDVRSGLQLEVRNRGARVVARPIVEIELPAGAELDEPTRERLSTLLAAPAELDGSTLRLALRPMAPGGFARIPIRARWSVGGALRGLGASAWDDTSAARADVRPVRVLASREVTLADRGDEPDEAEAEESAPPRPPPPPPPILRPLAEEVAR